MSRIGYYLRIAPADLAQLRQDPARAHPYVHQRAHDQALCVEKSADAIQILLDRVGLPIDVVRGGVQICTDCVDGGDGVAFFSVEEVRLAVEWFALVSFDELASDDPEHVRTHFDGLLQLFEAAAHDGDAVLRWFG